MNTDIKINVNIHINIMNYKNINVNNKFRNLKSQGGPVSFTMFEGL